MIEIKVQERIASLVDKTDIIVCDNSTYQIHFEFDDEWNGHEPKTAVFVWGNQNQEIVFYGNSVNVPQIDFSTVLAVGVYVSYTEDGVTRTIQTTTPATINTVNSVISGSVATLHPVPPEDIYNQIMALYNQLMISKIGDAPSDGNKYVRQNGSWVQDTGGGSGSEVEWTDILNKPVSFPPTSHEHDDRYYTESEVNNLLSEKISDTANDDNKYVRMHGRWVQYDGGGGTVSSPDWTDIQNKPATFTPSAHTHDDRYYTESEIDELVGDIPTKTSDLENDSGFLTSHQSLAAYRTSEAQDAIDNTKIGDALFDGNIYARQNGQWVISSASFPDWSNIQNKPETFTPSSHSHTKSQISDFSHTHDDRYYTESEIDTKLSGKSSTSHTHTSLGTLTLNGALILISGVHYGTASDMDDLPKTNGRIFFVRV